MDAWRLSAQLHDRSHGRFPVHLRSEKRRHRLLSSESEDGRPHVHRTIHSGGYAGDHRSEEHTSELQSLRHLVCRLLLEKKKDGAVYNAYRRRNGRASARKTPTERLAMVFDANRAVRRRLDGHILFFFLNKAAPPEIHLFPPRALLRI